MSSSSSTFKKLSSLFFGSSAAKDTVHATGLSAYSSDPVVVQTVIGNQMVMPVDFGTLTEIRRGEGSESGLAAPDTLQSRPRYMGSRNHHPELMGLVLRHTGFGETEKPRGAWLGTPIKGTRGKAMASLFLESHVPASDDPPSYSSVTTPAQRFIKRCVTAEDASRGDYACPTELLGVAQRKLDDGRVHLEPGDEIWEIKSQDGTWSVDMLYSPFSMLLASEDDHYPWVSGMVFPDSKFGSYRMFTLDKSPADTVGDAGGASGVLEGADDE